MVEVDWQRDLARQRRECETELQRIMRDHRGVPPRLRQAMAHSLFSGGKRLRPVLAAWCCDAFASRRRDADVAHRLALLAGAALEMIHTYSLIHDDLPAMDDDVLRRGRPTCHVAFDEATAILAGDALQALAFEVLAGAGKRAATLVALIAQAAGPAGMAGGQHDDLRAEGQTVTAAAVRRIHLRKTAVLIAASLAAGAVCAGAPSARVESVAKAGIDLGLAFQGADDVLDVTATSDQLGKSAGKDVAAGKATHIRVAGLAAAQARARRDGERGLHALRAAVPAGAAAERLFLLANAMWQRQR